VKNLLLSQEKNVRVVSENPKNRQQFFRALLAATKFYSVGENFSVDFGSDPQLTVRADFRIEKNQESLLKHEMTLLSVKEGGSAMPPSLVEFLGKEGFEVMQPFADQQHQAVKRGDLVQILDRDFKEIADGFMQSLGVPYEKDRRVELFNIRESGISLQVNADRYFEKAGDRFVVSYFEGDPIRYTLTRLLETRNYRVIILDHKDDLARVTDKFLVGMKMPGRFVKQELWPGGENQYSLKLSGVMIKRKGAGGDLFITDRDLDPLIVNLIDVNGLRLIRF
jgi:hypothetical protein